MNNLLDFISKDCCKEACIYTIYIYIGKTLLANEGEFFRFVTVIKTPNLAQKQLNF